MRIFTERDKRSPFVGEHIIYDTVEEFKEKNGSNLPLRKWGEGEIETLQAGNWIICDDGFILQVLRVKAFPNKTSGEYSYFVRVPMGTFCVYHTKSKGWVWRQLYGQFSVPQKSSISQRSRLYSPGTINKIKFATLCLSGISMVKAVKIIFPNLHKLTYNQLLIKAANLMNDKVVKKEMVHQIEKFSGDIAETFSDSRLLEELDMLLTRSRKGTDAHRTNIQFIMELRGLLSPKSSQKMMKVEEADYTEVPPSES